MVRRSRTGRSFHDGVFPRASSAPRASFFVFSSRTVWGRHGLELVGTLPSSVAPAQPGEIERNLAAHAILVASFFAAAAVARTSVAVFRVFSRIVRSRSFVPPRPGTPAFSCPPCVSSAPLPRVRATAPRSRCLLRAFSRASGSCPPARPQFGPVPTCPRAASIVLRMYPACSPGRSSGWLEVPRRSRSADQVALEFGKGGEDVEEHLPHGVVRVVNGLTQGQLDLASQELIGDLTGVGNRSGQSVELGHDERVAGAHGGKGLVETGAGARAAGEAVIGVDALGVDAEVDQGATLRGEVLSIGGAAGVADADGFHGTTVR